MTLEERMDVIKEIDDEIEELKQEKEEHLKLALAEMKELAIAKSTGNGVTLTRKKSVKFDSGKFTKYAKEHNITPITKTSTDGKGTADLLGKVDDYTKVEEVVGVTYSKAK